MLRLLIPLYPVFVLHTRHQTEFCKRYLRCEYLIGVQIVNMLLHSISFVKELNPCTGVKNVFIHQSSRLISRINSFLRPSLKADSILAASSGLSFQHPARDIRPRFRSSLDSLKSLAFSTDSAKDSVKNMITIFFSSRLMPCNKPEYGAIGVSNNFLATAVITLKVFISAAKLSIYSE